MNTKYLNDLDIGVAENSSCCQIENNKLSYNHFFGVIVVDGDYTISNTKSLVGRSEQQQ
jgi:parallel beta-helix repeat protein